MADELIRAFELPFPKIETPMFQSSHPCNAALTQVMRSAEPGATAVGCVYLHAHKVRRGRGGCGPGDGDGGQK